MIVKELIEKLMEVKNQNAKVITTREISGTGCDTCGYGAMTTEDDLYAVSWLDGSGEVELDFQ